MFPNGERNDATKGRFSAFLQINFEVVGVMFWKNIWLHFIKDIEELAVLFGNIVVLRWRVICRCSASSNFRANCSNEERLFTGIFADSVKRCCADKSDVDVVVEALW